MQNLPQELMETLHTDKKLRNEIASAIRCYTKDSVFKHHKTVSFPKEYLVTPEQIEFAKEIKESERLRLIEEKKNNNSITFINMGGTFESDPGFLNYHRMRAYFTNKNGRKFFIEVGSHLDKKFMRVDFSVDKDLEKTHMDLQEKTFDAYCEAKNKLNSTFIRNKTAEEVQELNENVSRLLEENRKAHGQPYYNYKNLEHKTKISYTESDLLDLINTNFDCNFQSVEVDRFDLNPDDTKIINISK